MSSSGRSSPASTVAVSTAAPGFSNVCGNSNVCESPGSSWRASFALRTFGPIESETPPGVTASVPGLETVTRTLTSRSAPTTSRESVTEETARLRIEAGSGSVRHTTGGGVRSWPKSALIDSQRPSLVRSQPTVWPSPATMTCFTVLFPVASVTAAAARAGGARIVPCEGRMRLRVSSRTRRSETGTGVRISGTGPPRMSEKAVPREAPSMYLPASSIAFSKLDLPSEPVIDIDEEPSTMSATSLFAPPPKRERLSLRSRRTAAAESAARTIESAIERRRHFG